MKFQPWIDFKPEIEKSIRISAPPCTACKFWRPERVFNSAGGYDGVRLCHKGVDTECEKGMESDFSCYEEKIYNEISN